MKKSDYLGGSTPAKKNRRGLFLFLGIFIGIALFCTFYQVTVYFSSNESCMMCHVHPHAEDNWRMGKHGGNNSSGVVVNCVDCHLPPSHDTFRYFTAKARHGLNHVWAYITMDSTDLANRWAQTLTWQEASLFVYTESCMQCHQNLFPAGISDNGIISHLYFEENHERLNLQCISCHLDAGHHNPNWAHGQMVGVPGMSTTAVDTSLFFREPATVTAFVNYTEQIPGTSVSFNMIAIPGGTFMMGSPENEPFRNADESPQHEVTISPFFMAEVETTWDQFWAFYAETMSEGRTPPEVARANNLNAQDIDGMSGPTAPFGNPDQGWGGGDRPAITMTHYAATVFTQWLSKKTDKTYRLPTEAEWEFAARGGTQTAYFFPGSPRDFSDHGFLRNIFRPNRDGITPFVIFDYNSNGRTQLPSAVQPNPFGLINMLGNVMEYTADRYDPNAYQNRNGVVDPIVTEGDEWVVRGGFFGSDASEVRSAARAHTHHDEWLRTDPQQPKSIWWYADVRGIGFRVVAEPSSIINNTTQITAE